MVTAFTVEKGTTGLPILERGATERALWSVFSGAISGVRDSNLLLENLSVNTGRMLESASAYWAQGADIAGVLVRDEGISWRSAHQIVGILIRHCCEQGVLPRSVTPAMLDEASIEYWEKPLNVSAESLSEAIDPSACVARRTLYGGPAPESHERELAALLVDLKDDHVREERRRNSLEAAARDLESVIDEILSSEG